jgi:hypothetical protein
VLGFAQQTRELNAKNSIAVEDSNSQLKLPAEQEPQQDAMLPPRLARWINDELGERKCGRQQQHERQGVGSEAGVMAAGMLIRSCIFSIGP